MLTTAKCLPLEGILTNFLTYKHFRKLDKNEISKHKIRGKQIVDLRVLKLMYEIKQNS